MRNTDQRLAGSDCWRIDLLANLTEEKKKKKKTTKRKKKTKTKKTNQFIIGPTIQLP